jgi:hypothetical protein
MNLDWLPRAVVPFAVVVMMALFRRIAPGRERAAHHRYDERQDPEPLPTGAVGAAMWSLGIVLALSFFVLRGANRRWAHLEGPAILTQFATQAIWCFFPGFAALAVPWPLTVWYLRRRGRWEEADSIEDESDRRGGGVESYQVMKWLSFGLVCPIAFFTLLAIPIHLSITDSEVRVGHYASWRPEKFEFKDARRLTVIEGYRIRDGEFKPAKDLVIDFADGRRLRGNAVGDGGTSIRDDVMNLLLEKIGLTPGHARTLEEIPVMQGAR